MMKMPLAVSILSLLAAPAFAQSVRDARYVAMGSSYAAGPGVGVPDRTSGACDRSLSNYARQIAGHRHLMLVDVSCSGAVTDNIMSQGQHGFPAQIEAVTTDTRLVSILIGGNDVDYVGQLSGLSCRDTGGDKCRVLDDAAIDARLATLPGRLDRMIAEVKRRAPAARIVLLGYLPAVPAQGDGCTALPLSPADVLRMRSLAIRLARAIGGAAARGGIGIVRSTMVGAGHDACAAQPFVAGYHPPRNPGWAAPVAYHPNQTGMDHIAAALDAAIDG